MEFFSQFGIDLLFAVLLVISTLTAIRKGFLKCALSLVSVLLAFVVASSLNEPVAEWCYDSFISDFVVEKVENNLPEDIDYDSVVESIPDFVVEHLGNKEIEDTVDELKEKDLSTHKIAEKISDKFISPVIILVLKLICYIIIFLILRFLLGIVSRIICKFVDIPALKQLNKALGGVLGFLKGLFVVFSLAVALNFVAQLLNKFNIDVEIVQAIENSFICDIISDIVK